MTDPVVLTDDHAHCERLRMCLAEAGLNPDRVMCRDDGLCVVGCGTGSEGLPNEEVERIVDRAIALANWEDDDA